MNKHDVKSPGSHKSRALDCHSLILKRVYSCIQSALASACTLHRNGVLSNNLMIHLLHMQAC